MTSIGPYEIIREVGRGGMGVVYLAFDTRLERRVAIKSLPEAVESDPSRLERFEREARVLAALNHPNVAGIYGLEEQGGGRYLVLEYVEGETLAERLDRGPLDVDEAVEIAVAIAHGLAAAHEAGVIHRDLKPSNIKITPDGAVKVLDFGLARADDGSVSSGEGLSQSPTLTRPVPEHSPTMPGAILGTAAYMSPEQARGRRVDKRTDIWAFGVILFEMLTGASPFHGETATDSLGAVLHKALDLRRLPTGTPAGVRAAIERCVERDRDLRYRDIADVRIEIERGLGQAAQEPERGRRGRLVGVAASGWALAAVLVVSMVVWGAAWRGASPSVREVRSAVFAPAGYQIEGFEISPGGEQVAMIVSPIEVGTVPGPRRSMIALRDLAARDAGLVAGTGGVKSLKYSPDGRDIAFLTKGDELSETVRLLRFPRDGSAAPVEVLRIPPGVSEGSTDHWFCYTRSGEIVMLHREERVLLLLDPGSGRELRRVPLAEPEVVDRIGAFVGPLGDRSIVVHVERFTQDGFTGDSARLDVETGVLTILAQDAVWLRPVPGDSVVFARSETVFLSGCDPSGLQLRGGFRPVQAGLGTTHHWAHGEFRVADDGTLVYAGGGVQGQSRRLVFVDRDGTVTPWFDERRAFEEHAAVSPDGSRLATIISGPGGLYELWVSETDRARLRRLHAEPGGDVYQPVFTPDGEWIIAMCWREGPEAVRRLVAIRFDGSAPPIEVWSGWERGTWVVPMSVSHDGERVLLVRYAAGRSTLCESPLDGTAEPRVLLEIPEIYTPRYAPSDAPLLCYVSTETGRAEVFVRTIEAGGPLGGAVPVTSKGAWVCEWMIDPEDGLCIVHFDLAWQEYLTPIAFAGGRVEIGETRATGRTGNTRYGDRAITRDGRYLVIEAGEDEQPVTHLGLVQGWLGAMGRR